MKTKLLKASENSIDLACKLLKEGEVVAIPTETVYGLAADAKNPKAIAKIFKAKGRPQDNPLIVHISNMEMLKIVAKKISSDAKKLAKAFWPGPLTMILPKNKAICDEVSANLDSVGIRMPQNKVAREIIERSNTPLAAPSANLSGKPSPTNAHDVYTDLSSKIPLIIDGGESEAGVESTVISMLNKTPIILRPGVITKKQIEAVLNKQIELSSGITQMVGADEEVLSPGMKYKHYAPNAKLIILKGGIDKFVPYVEKNAREGSFVLCFKGEEKLFKIPAISFGQECDPYSLAHNLFSALRRLDELHATTVFVRCPSVEGVSLAVYNRLIRAAGFNIIDL